MAFDDIWLDGWWRGRAMMIVNFVQADGTRAGGEASGLGRWLRCGRVQSSSFLQFGDMCVPVPA
jgi:hypothetical protein